MTMPCERVWAVQNTRQFLFDLLDPKKTPGVPKLVRMKARSLLKHYPLDSYLQQVLVDHPNTHKINY